MRFRCCALLAFWREWLLVSTWVFGRTVVALFVVLSLAWPLLAPLHPCLFSAPPVAAADLDADEPWPCELAAGPEQDE
jgi:hypothetical protein